LIGGAGGLRLRSTHPTIWSEESVDNTMKILIADDDLLYRRLLETAVRQWGYDPVVVCDGAAAWEVLSGPAGPSLAILDWEMPHVDGPELCRRFRAECSSRPLYAMMLTGRNDPGDLIAGLQAGADDFLTKPFDRQELLSRLRVGVRVVQLQLDLAAKVAQLEEALANVKHLQGLLPICCYCKSIRDDGNYWRRVEDYLGEHSDIQFSHGICPKCFATVVEPELRAVQQQAAG
jgi:sigma-B regulation protein RsbU (phosphoserine phosphatase)